MNFTAKDVADLRAKTGCGMMDCKKALVEAEGDIEKATEILREKGLAASVKKAGRIAAEGVAFAKVSDCGKIGVAIEVNAETDFVAKNDSFQEFVRACANTVIEKNPADVEALLACQYGDTTIDAMLKDRILVIGENMKIRRFVRLEGDCVAYVHGGGRIGVLVRFDADENCSGKSGLVECGKDVAMQIAALNPLYLNEEAVPAGDVAKEKEILIAQIKNEPKNANKPDAIIEKMIGGRINKFFEQNCLMNQAFVKNGDLTVGKYIEEEAKKLGGTMKAVEFVRFEKGEGLEKRNDNFADEVAGMVK